MSRFVVAFLLTRLLGAEQYGLYSVGLSAAALAGGLAMLGLDAALVRYVALYANRRDDERLRGSLELGIGLAVILSVLTSTVLFALAQVIAVNVFHDPRLAPVLQLVAFAVPFLQLSNVLAGAANGFKDMWHMVLAQNLVQPILRVILIVALALVGLNVNAAIIIYGLSDMAASVVFIYYLRKQPALRRATRGRRETREVLSYSFPMWLSGMITTFRGNIQTILLGSLNTVFTVGIFSVANQLNLFGDMVQTSVTTSVRPIIVEVHDSKNWEQMGKLYQTVSKWLFAFNFPVFLITILFPTQIMAIFGKSFEQGATALVLLSWASVVDAATGMCGAILDMTGRTRLKLINSIARLGAVLILSLLLIPIQGMLGAAIAALLGEIIVNVMRVLEVFVLFRILPYSAGFFRPIVAGIVALLVTLGALRWVPVNEAHLHVLMGIALLSSIYIIGVVLFGLEPEDRIVLSRMRRRATRRFSQSRA